MNVHHLIPLHKQSGSSPYDIAELLTLCVFCHKERHARNDPERNKFRNLVKLLLKGNNNGYETSKDPPRNVGEPTED